MSATREAIAALVKEGLTLSEIAHRLGLANSTVGYHARALKEERDKPLGRDTRPRGGGPPAAPPTVTRERVRRLLEQGYARAKIAETLGIARSTVTYHAGRLGAGIDGRFARRYDWRAISRFYERGHSVADCQAMFGFDRNAWHDPSIEA